jgi:phosphoenolpyruvate carboxylase
VVPGGDPIDVIARMQIGSRPAVRPGREGLEACAPCRGCSRGRSRVTCCRLVRRRVGLETVIDELGIGVARSAYNDWTFFSTLIDDLEASLARADLEIAAAYESLADSRFAGCGTRVREEFELVRQQVLEIKQTSGLLDRDPTLQRPSSCVIPTWTPSTCCRSIY